MAWQLYILQSESTTKHYIGITENLIQRLEFHNSLGHGFTARYRPWKVVFSKEFPNRQLAQIAEQKIKSRKSRKYIESVINRSILL